MSEPVEPTSITLPQLQLALMALYSGWIPCFIFLSLYSRVAIRAITTDFVTPNTTQDFWKRDCTRLGQEDQAGKGFKEVKTKKAA